MKNKKVENTKKVKAVIKGYKPSKNDPGGSYTGNPVNKREVPTQDADDI